MEQLPTILGALVLAAVLWVLKGTSENTAELKVVRVLIAGVQTTIERTIEPELGRLRDSSHKLRDTLQEILGRLERLDERTTQVERNVQMLWDGTDRRTGHDRRDVT